MPRARGNASLSGSCAAGGAVFVGMLSEEVVSRSRLDWVQAMLLEGPCAGSLQACLWDL